MIPCFVVLYIPWGIWWLPSLLIYLLQWSPIVQFDIQNHAQDTKEAILSLLQDWTGSPVGRNRKIGRGLSEVLLSLQEIRMGTNMNLSEQYNGLFCLL